MDKDNVSNIYDGIVFSHKDEGNSPIWMELKDIMLSEISQTEKDKYCVTSLIWRILFF